MLRIPTFLVFGLTRRITAHRIQNQPPFPRNVIIFITGVRISDRRYCWIRSRSSSSRFCIECKILIYTLLLNQHSPLPLFIFLQTIQMIPFYFRCYLCLPVLLLSIILYFSRFSNNKNLTFSKFIRISACPQYLSYAKRPCTANNTTAQGRFPSRYLKSFL